MQKIRKSKKRRSDYKRLTKEGLVLKYMRESRQISMRKAAKIVGVSEAKINHSENGRMDIKPDFVQLVVTAYDYSYQDFLDFLTGKKQTPEHLLSECIELLKRVKPEKLRSVKTILVVSKSCLQKPRLWGMW